MTALLGVSLKMYLSASATRRWMADVRKIVDARPQSADIFVLPTFPLLESTLSTLAGSGIAVGAQDVAASPEGAQTGQVSAAVLAELGCKYVVVGHAERRNRGGDDDATVVGKARQAVEHGLVPVVCSGEPTDVGPAGAINFCRTQLAPVLAACSGAPVVVAYEPVWAIGAARPAPPAHVRIVAEGLRPVVGDASLLYGGSAGPGLFGELGGTVDGLFLGRRAHDPAGFAAVLDQIAPARAAP